MSLAANLQLINGSVTPPKLDINAKFSAAGLTATTAMVVTDYGANSTVTPEGLFTAYSGNDIEAHFHTVRVDGDSTLFLNNDSDVNWSVGIKGSNNDYLQFKNDTAIDGGGSPIPLNAMTISTIGQLAVGTDTPNSEAVLDITTNDSSSGSIRLYSTQSNADFRIHNATGPICIGTCSNNAVKMFTNSSATPSIDLATDGTVGVGGAADASYTMNVVGDLNFTGNLYQGGTLAQFSNWSIDGSNIYRLSDVGVGVIPTTLLDIKETTAATSAIVKIRDTGDRTVEIQSPNSATNNGRIGTTTNHIFEINAGPSTGSNNSAALTFHTDTTERVRITNDGKMIVGNVGSSQVWSQSSGHADLQISRSSWYGGAMISTHFTGGSNAAFLSLARSNGSIGTPTQLVTGDHIGAINFLAYDGTNNGNGATEPNYKATAQILVRATCDHGVGDLPSAMVLRTTNDAECDFKDRIIINENGCVGLNLPALDGLINSNCVPEVSFHVAGNEIRLDNRCSANDGFIRFMNSSGQFSIGMSGATANDLLFFDRQNNQTAANYAGGAADTAWALKTNDSTRLCIVHCGQVVINGNKAVLGSPPDSCEPLVVNGTDGGGIMIVGGTSNPTNTQVLGSLGFKGVDSVNTNAAAEAKIEAVATENHSGSTAQTELQFYTKTTGTGPGSAPRKAMTIDAAGNIDQDGPYLYLGGRAGTYNGTINNVASVRINIDSDNNSTGESFVIGHNQCAQDANNKLLTLDEGGNLCITGNIDVAGSFLSGGAGTQGFWTANGNDIYNANSGTVCVCNDIKVMLPGVVYTCYCAVSGSCCVDFLISPNEWKVLEVFGAVNVNTAGSTAYRDMVHGYIYNGVGYDGSSVDYYIYSQDMSVPGRTMILSGSACSGNLPFEAYFLETTSCETQLCTAFTTPRCLRIHLPGIAGLTNSAACIYITRRM